MIYKQKKIKTLQNSINQKSKQQDSKDKLIQLPNNLDADFKNRILGNISHEVRTPVNGILGLLKILKHKDAAAENLKIYSEIEDLTNQLSSFINDVLDYTKLNSNVLQLDKINFNLFDELDEIIKIHKKHATGDDFVYECEHDLSNPVFVKGDSMRFKQIINNSIRDVINFADKGCIKLSTYISNNQDDTISFFLKITNSAIIPSKANYDYLKLLFDRGYINKGDNNCIGAGFPITKSLIELMDGEISFEKAEEGSSFFLKISFEKGTIPDGGVAPKRKILLVEDNLINQKVSSFSLKNLGYDVDIADNGEIAIQMFIENDYDLILMDVQMPVMDGITATKYIRSIEKRNNVKEPINIIAITANSLKEDREQCFAAGMNEYISKPFSLEKFPQILSQFEKKR